MFASHYSYKKSPETHTQKAQQKSRSLQVRLAHKNMNKIEHVSLN